MRTHFFDQLRGLADRPAMTTSEAQIIPVEFNKGSATVKAGKTTTFYNVKDRDYTRLGVRHEGHIRMGHHVAVTPGEQIRLWGTRDEYDAEAKEFKKVSYNITFKIGDEAEYDSYNLIYTGKITKITNKTVMVKDPNYENKRLNFHDFSTKNHNFDAEDIARRNAETYQTI